MNEMPSYISWINGGHVVASVGADDQIETVQRLGGHPISRSRTNPAEVDRYNWRIEYQHRNDGALAVILTDLRDHDFAFVFTGHGIEAGDQFERLRNDGLVDGVYRAIWWRGPGLWETHER